MFIYDSTHKPTQTQILKSTLLNLSVEVLVLTDSFNWLKVKLSRTVKPVLNLVLTTNSDMKGKNLFFFLLNLQVYVFLKQVVILISFNSTNL